MRSEKIPLEKRELRELINKNWMTHDAMWFYNCLQECGIEKTNKINKAAIKGMAATEIKRMKKALSIEKIETFEEYKHFFDSVMAIATGDFMKYSYNYAEHNFMHAEWRSCFAYDGMKALGTIS